MAVDKDRIEGCDLLTHPEKLNNRSRKFRRCLYKDFPKADIIVLDDALQYRKLKPNLNIILVDYNRPIDKDMILPLGRLRDLPERMKEADIIIVTKCPYDLEDYRRVEFSRSLYVRDYNPVDCTAIASDGKKQLVLFSHIEYDKFLPVFPESDPHYIYSKRLVLFTGIARNLPLLIHLGDIYKIVYKHTFSDHHKYSWSDFRMLLNAVRKYPTAAVATTEKDAQRVLDHNSIPSELKERMFYVPISVKFLTDKEKDIFEKRVTTL